MRIPDTVIDEVRAASDIVDVVAAAVPLKKRGKSYVGLCPFHKEKTPSFTVSAERQMYHCFGCGAGGNVFGFVMAQQKLSFVEAVRVLAERAGIALPAQAGGREGEASEHEELYAACRTASEFFRDAMMRTVEGKLALEYFRHRGFTDETIAAFGLGYAPAGWDALLRHAEGKGIAPAVLERAGLAVKREDGSGHYDRFRGRAIFPISSPSGRVIGFGARKLREDDPLAKYINSPETPIYQKSRVLYGLFQAREALREDGVAALVEGYADLISVFQAGVRNVVASSGTALTDGQVRLLSRYARTVLLVYDADSAGSKAAFRGLDVIIENGLEVRVVSLPAGEDPDSYVRKNGGDAFRRLLEGAVSFVDFKAALFEAEGAFATPEGRTRAVRSMVETIARMKDRLQQSFFVKHLAERYGLYESVLYRELEAAGARLPGAPDPGPAHPAQEGGGTGPAPASRNGFSAKLTAPERDLLKLMLAHGPEMVRYVMEHAGGHVFGDERAARLFRHLEGLANDEAPVDAAVLADRIDDPGIRSLLAELAVGGEEISASWAKFGAAPQLPDPWETANRCIIALRKTELELLIAENQRKMREATARGEPVRPFLEEHQALLRERRDLEQAAGRAG